MSEIKVNKVSPRTNCGTVQLGDSGDTITIPAGATITNNGTQTGFGRTGTVDWQTGSIKTSTFTATSGEGYFVNTTGGAVTVNLPAGTAGAIVGLKDYAGTWNSNAVTLNPNGSDKIGGGSATDPTLENKGGALLLVFVDSVQGWLTTAESVTESPSGIENFITATGGTITTVCTNFKVHTFTSPGTFCVSQVATCAANNAVAYMVVAGGGGGARGSSNGSGAGAGGYREGTTAPIVPYTASPLVNSSGVTVSAQGYPIVVGAGGAGSPVGGTGSQGSTSSGLSISSAGGGGGGAYPGTAGGNGGSGGGGGGPSGSAGSGNTPPVSPPQGNNGGTAPTGGPQAGGGGATAVGSNGHPSPGNSAGPGGAGATSSINGTPTARAGGGGGGHDGGPAAGAGGSGGGGAGSTNNAPGGAGTANTGGGGGGNGPINGLGGAGGSGIVIIRYKFQ